MSRLEDLALGGGSDVNPLKSDPDLVNLLKKLDKVKKFKTFQRWKSKFLNRLEQFLYEDGMDPAEKDCTAFDKRLKGCVKHVTKVQGFIEKGDLGKNSTSVKATLALKEMCTSLAVVADELSELIPSLAKEEKRRGFTKFHLGAVLIRQGFHQYISMKIIEDAVNDIGAKLGDVADKQQHELFAEYDKRCVRFCDVMADLNLYEVMMKCIEFAEAPEEEESSDEEPVTIKITIEAPEGRILRLELDITETIGNIKDAIAEGCGITPEKQVLKIKEGGELDKNDGTLQGYGIDDGAVLTVEPYTIPITVNNVMDGTKITLNVEPEEYLSNIKRKLEKESGVPAKDQRLFLKGKELADPNKTAKDYGIKKGSELDMEPKSIKVFVETPDGKTHEIKVSPSDTADSIKEKIADVAGIDAPKQVLTFEGKELPDGKALKDLGVKDGSTISVDIFKVPITVNTWDGNKIKMMVDPTAYMSNIKRDLEKESGVPAKDQRLFMNGEELADPNKTASEYGIKKGSVLDMEPRSIKVSVETPDGKTHSIEISPSDTADEVKATIAKKTGIEVPRQVLKFQGKELPDDSPVKDMGVGDGSTLKVDIFKVPITVTDMDGNKITVMVDPLASLSDLKKDVEKESGVPAKDQRLFMDGMELVGNKSASDYGIKKGSVLDMEPKTINVTVETPDGKVHSLEISPSATTETTKALIDKQTGFAVHRQVLKLKDWELPSGSKLKNAGVRDGTALRVEILTIPIKVETEDDKTLWFDVEPSSNIEALKKRIHKETGIEPKKQLLKFGDKELKDARSTIEGCGMEAHSWLTVEAIADPIIFVDIKCGTLFGMERELVIKRQALSPLQGNKFDFTESATDSATKEKILKAMKDSPTLGVATQVVVTKEEVEDYELAEAEKVKDVWGVNLKKREKNVKGEEFFFVDPKAKACGELSRKKYIDMKFITIVRSGDKEKLEEAEKDDMKYDKYIKHIRDVFNVKSAN